MVGSQTVTVVLQPRDPIIVRDARPFSADPGARAVTLGWPPPQTVAGALRTHVGGALGYQWTEAERRQAREFVVRGPFLVARSDDAVPWTVYVPGPQDAVVYGQTPDQRRAYARRPLPADQLAGGGCDLPDPGIEGGLCPIDVPVLADVQGGHDYWSLDDTVAWLSEPRPTRPPATTVGGLPRDRRIHVAIDRATQTSLEGALFSTTALSFPEIATTRRPAKGTLNQEREPILAKAMLCRLEAIPAAWQPQRAFLSVGGERRLVALEPAHGESDPWPAPAESLVKAIAGARRVRLQLLTPTIFTPGWRPAWLDPETLRGAPPEISDLRLRLVGALVGRRLGMSGWDLATRQPKRVRYAAPAGSVYFFSVENGALTEAQIRRLWLHPISDDTQDRIDGAGLVLPGVW
ncbi:MAG: type III-B CRISPR module-associated protein Cmr3 [Chloroflexi bacterium]|nr:type III-B CRISPR module-associated protein Cmr3 [Chloroflexota bacterium]